MKIRIIKSVLALSVLFAFGQANAQVNTQSGTCADSSCSHRTMAVTGPGSASASATSVPPQNNCVPKTSNDPAVSCPSGYTGSMYTTTTTSCPSGRFGPKQTATSGYNMSGCTYAGPVVPGPAPAPLPPGAPFAGVNIFAGIVANYISPNDTAASKLTLQNGGSWKVDWTPNGYLSHGAPTGTWHAPGIPDSEFEITWYLSYVYWKPDAGLQLQASSSEGVASPLDSGWQISLTDVRGNCGGTDASAVDILIQIRLKSDPSKVYNSPNITLRAAGWDGNPCG